MTAEVNDYLNQIGKVPLLTPEEEIELGRIIQKANESADQDLSAQEKKRLLRQAAKARERIVAANLRLCFNIAKKYANNTRSLSVLDLAQEGAVGLHRAAERFDPARGYKFSTFAYWWIRQSITRAITDKDGMIRMPCHRVQELSRFRKAVVEAMKTGEHVNPRELAKRIGVNYECTEIAANTKVVSLDCPTSNNDEDPTPLLDFIADQRNEDQDDDPLLETLPRCIQMLAEVDRRVIKGRYFDNMEFKDIAKALNLKASKVRSINQHAIAKLRRLANNELHIGQQELAI